jgi:hypothetical protein
VWYHERVASTEDALINTGFVDAVFIMCSFPSLSLCLVFSLSLLVCCTRVFPSLA